MSSASGWGGVSTEDALAGAVAFGAAMRAGGRVLAAEVDPKPDAPPHLAHEWGCLTEAERADVLAWAAGQVRAATLRALAADAERELHFATSEDDQRYRPLVRAWLESRAQALDEGEARPIVHAVPPAGSGLTPCCRRSPFELAHDDRMTWEVSVVTCGGHVTEADGG